MIIISNFPYNFINFRVIVNLLTKSLVSLVSIVLTFLTNSSYSVFLTTLVFTALFSLLESTSI